MLERFASIPSDPLKTRKADIYAAKPTRSIGRTEGFDTRDRSI